jgi:dihydroorotase
MIKIVGAKLTDGRVIDLDIDNQVIVKIENSTNNLSKGAVDGSSKLLIPGLVDMHTHLREPGREDSETVLTGSRAAVAGGSVRKRSRFS